MKIVQINGVYRLNSTGRTTYELHQWLKSNNHQSYVFVANEPLEKEEGVFVVGSKFDRKYHSLMSRLTGKQGYFSKRYTLKLLEQFDRINPDIVILRVLHSNFVNLPLLLNYLSEKNIVTIVVLHDCWLFTGYCNYYSSVGCLKWQSECNNCPRIHDGGGNTTWFFDRSNEIFKDRMKYFHSIKNLVVVGVSNWIAEEAKKAPVFSNARKILGIYNWIDLNVFYPKDNDIRKKYNIGVSDFVVLGVSTSWSSHKGLEVIIELAKRLPNYCFILVGKLPDTSILPSNILAIGSCNKEEELACFYSMADVFISPSKQETFGKVIAEALACGTPAIVNKATAMPELVTEGCGYVVENNSIDEFCKYIKLVNLNGKKYYSYECLQKANKLFDKEKNIKKYIALFEEMIK